MALEKVGAFNKPEKEHLQKPVLSSMRRRELSVTETTFGVTRGNRTLDTGSTNRSFTTKL